MILFSLLFYFTFTWSIVLSTDPPPACRIKLPSDHQSEVLLNNLKWKEPKTSPAAGGTLQLECPTGFLNSDLKDKKQTFKCNRGKYDGKFKFEDLLCRNDFHKLNFAQKIPAKDLPSTLLSCSAPGWDVYKVGRDAAGAEKILYYVCLDRNTMRTKFTFKPASNTKPVTRFTDREGDVWGFDGYGASAEDRKRLSQGYVKVLQQRRMTQAFADTYKGGKTFPHYFNRGHLVAYADFANVDDQKATVEYLNAAPQWDVLNKHSWSLIERETRNILQDHPEQWEVYTGTYGVVQSPKGQVNLVAQFDDNGKFVKALLPLPQLFWKIVYNKVERKRSRVFIGVNNPEFKTFAAVTPVYKVCQSKNVDGNEFKGFTYECDIDEFLPNLNVKEKIVKQ